MPGTRVDVGIVSWNTRDLTLAAVQHVLSQATDGLDVRVLVRDNGSTDGTADAVRAAHPEVVVESGDNVGFAAGVNALLARSDAPWFFLVNSDAWPEEGALAAQLDACDRRPSAGLIAPRLLRPDGVLEESVHPLPSVRLAARGLVGRFGAQPTSEGSVGWAVGAALLLRRDAVEEIGPWDDRFFMYAEDLDYCWRAAALGWQVCFVPQAVVRHVGNASGSQRFGERREQVAIRNANLVVAERLGPWRAAAWRGLNAAAAVRMALRAERQRDRGRADHWWRQVPAHWGRR